MASLDWRRVTSPGCKYCKEARTYDRLRKDVRIWSFMLGMVTIACSAIAFAITDSFKLSGWMLTLAVMLPVGGHMVMARKYVHFSPQLDPMSSDSKVHFFAGIVHTHLLSDRDFDPGVWLERSAMFAVNYENGTLIIRPDIPVASGIHVGSRAVGHKLEFWFPDGRGNRLLEIPSALAAIECARERAAS